jgi:hypothetical protein
MVVVAAAIFLAFRFLGRPVPVVPPETFVHPETEALLVARVEHDDPLLVGLGARLLGLQEVRGLVPTRDGREFRIGAERAREVVLGLAPIQVVALQRPAEGEQRFRRGIVVSVGNLSYFAGFVAKAIMLERSEHAEFEDYEGAELITSRGGPILAARRNNYMAGDDREMVTYWVERLKEQRARAAQGGRPAPQMDAPEPLKAAYGRLDPGAPIRFASLNAHGELALLLDLSPVARFRERFQAAGLAEQSIVSVSGQLEPLNSLDAALTAFIECADADFAIGLEAATEELAAEHAQHSPLREVRVVREAVVLRLEARVENLPEKAAALVRHLAARAEADEGQGPGRPTAPSP